MKSKKKIINVLIHVLLGILAVIWILPILWVIMTSLRAGKGSYSDTFLPAQLTLNNYKELFTNIDIFNFPRWFGNTFFVAIFTCILSTYP